MIEKWRQANENLCMLYETCKAFENNGIYELPLCLFSQFNGNQELKNRKYLFFYQKKKTSKSKVSLQTWLQSVQFYRYSLVGMYYNRHHPRLNLHVQIGIHYAHEDLKENKTMSKYSYNLNNFTS